MQQAGFNKIIAGLFIIGALVGLYFQFAFHKFLNNDTLSYINLAERYAAGDWEHAINGYWSPMYSWLLCCCKLVHLPLLPCCYVINFIFAGSGLYILCKFAYRYLKQALFYFAFSGYALLLMLYYAMSTLTPDLMATVLCLGFLLLITDNRFSHNKQFPLLAGLAGACAYFSKAYNFVPIHLFLGLLALLVIFKNTADKLKHLIPILKTYGVFIILSAIWITVLSIHENKLCFATSGRLNHNLVNPDYGKDFPTNENLSAPPFPTAYSIHTDPTHLLDAYDWSPFSDERNFHHQLTLIKGSFSDLIWNLDNTGAKWLVLFASLLILAITRNKRKEIIYDRSIHNITWFFACYPLLYLPLFILDRYILTDIILFHLLLFFVAQQAWGQINKKIFLPVISMLLLLSIVPFIKIGHRKLTQASSEYQYYKGFYQQVPQLSFLKDQSIAVTRNSLVEATQLCYYLQCRNYNTWTDMQYQSLKQFNIRFLLSKTELSAYPFLHIKKKMLLSTVAFYVYEVE
ncbi:MULTISPECIES: hypothetical protein [Niastella]|uniref:Glycosyltransferase RgtA/B/C/D-like domain-containing protein n=1 Tax=Niastella soli TaxID=2821487 RepID=A0ABS3YNV3_9BACT|nr:hypothetical protein [Niastella soli]MBO9199498.1 hypothetical protein [Niastella soli]